MDAFIAIGSVSHASLAPFLSLIILLVVSTHIINGYMFAGSAVPELALAMAVSTLFKSALTVAPLAFAIE
ncbi:MAG: hypothetical protein GY893_05870 [bacterium]|nr:hypothetical protein [bacterium]